MTAHDSYIIALQVASEAALKYAESLQPLDPWRAASLVAAVNIASLGEQLLAHLADVPVPKRQYN